MIEPNSQILSIPQAKPEFAAFVANSNSNSIDIRKRV